MGVQTGLKAFVAAVPAVWHIRAPRWAASFSHRRTFAGAFRTVEYRDGNRLRILI